MAIGFDQDIKLFGALWVYQIDYKVHISQTPFQLVYGQETILLIELELPSLCIALQERLSLDDSIKDQYALLEKLDEIHQYALQHIELVQRRWKNYYNSQFLIKKMEILYYYTIANF